MRIALFYICSFAYCTSLRFVGLRLPFFKDATILIKSINSFLFIGPCPYRFNVL